MYLRTRSGLAVLTASLTHVLYLRNQTETMVVFTAGCFSQRTDPILEAAAATSYDQERSPFQKLTFLATIADLKNIDSIQFSS